MTQSQKQEQLRVTVAQRSSAGVKPENEDCIGLTIPDGSALWRKGIVAAIADGVSAAEAGGEASEIAVKSFISDYYSTPDSWSVKQSAHKVLIALNRWLYSQGQEFLDAEKGYVTTFSSLILKSQSAYLFHVGDSRIYRLRDECLELMTRDHVARMSAQQSYLARALGIDLNLDIDLRVLELEPGDVFLLTTDGVHGSIDAKTLEHQVRSGANDLQALADQLVDLALQNGSDDNLSCQLVRVESLGKETDQDVFHAVKRLPFPPELSKGLKLDGWRILDQIHASQRSQLYLVEHEDTQQRAVMKTPSHNYMDDVAYLERFMMEEWVGFRIDSPSVVKVVKAPKRRFLFYLTEFIEGPTLAQLMDRGSPLDIPRVTAMADKLVQGLRAFHRKETLHQDLKPDNIVMRGNDPVIIDFGSVYVAGVDEIATSFQRESALGTLDYSAPEYRLQRPRNEKSDQFSLAVVLYELLTLHHPFGDAYQKAQTVSDFLDLKYVPAYRRNPLVPVWMDGALHKAMQVNADLRYETLSEFLNDLQNPNPQFLRIEQRPLIEKDPVRFWQLTAIVLFLTNLLILVLWLG